MESDTDVSCDGLESEVVAHVCAIEASPGPSRFGLWSTAWLLPSALPDTSLHSSFLWIWTIEAVIF